MFAKSSPLVRFLNSVSCCACMYACRRAIFNFSVTLCALYWNIEIVLRIACFVFVIFIFSHKCSRLNPSNYMQQQRTAPPPTTQWSIRFLINVHLPFNENNGKKCVYIKMGRAEKKRETPNTICIYILFGVGVHFHWIACVRIYIRVLWSCWLTGMAGMAFARNHYHFKQI